MTTMPAGARSETPTGKIVPLALPSVLVDRPPWAGGPGRGGRHGEARRRYRSYAERMDEIDVEVEPFPAVRRRRGDGAFSPP